MYETFRSVNPLTDVFDNYAFIYFNVTQFDDTDSPNSRSSTPVDRNLTKDTQKSYEVTVNIFS